MSTIERKVERRMVKWRSSTDSDPVEIQPGAGFNLYVPSTFAGTGVTIKALVKRAIDPGDIVAGEEQIDDYKAYSAAAIAVTADTVIDLTAFQLFGLDKIKFVSTASENCTGELILAG